MWNLLFYEVNPFDAYNIIYFKYDLNIPFCLFLNIQISHLSQIERFGTKDCPNRLFISIHLIAFSLLKIFNYGIADNNKYHYLWTKSIHCIDINNFNNISEL